MPSLYLSTVLALLVSRKLRKFSRRSLYQTSLSAGLIHRIFTESRQNCCTLMSILSRVTETVLRQLNIKDAVTRHLLVCGQQDVTPSVTTKICVPCFWFVCITRSGLDMEHRNPYIGTRLLAWVVLWGIFVHLFISLLCTSSSKLGSEHFMFYFVSLPVFCTFGKSRYIKLAILW